jgi:hypothetical protein
MLPKKLEIFDPSISAHNNMRANGYIKIFEMGQLKFGWNKA